MAIIQFSYFEKKNAKTFYLGTTGPKSQKHEKIYSWTIRDHLSDTNDEKDSSTCGSTIGGVVNFLTPKSIQAPLSVR